MRLPPCYKWKLYKHFIEWKDLGWEIICINDRSLGSYYIEDRSTGFHHGSVATHYLSDYDRVHWLIHVSQGICLYKFESFLSWEARGQFSIKMSSFHYGNPHVKDKTVATVLSLTWESPYYTWERWSLYWGGSLYIFKFSFHCGRPSAPLLLPMLRLASSQSLVDHIQWWMGYEIFTGELSHGLLSCVVLMEGQHNMEEWLLLHWNGNVGIVIILMNFQCSQWLQFGQYDDISKCFHFNIIHLICPYCTFGQQLNYCS